MRNWIATFALLALFLSAPAFLMAQDSSSMNGTVTDATGAVVPGTTVTVSSKLTGAHYTQTTDKNGAYRFPNLPPNSGYDATFVHSGFATSRVDQITLSVGITRTQDETAGREQ
jgi:Carboxypeptidase regulatory-like domain